jgi:autotransporter-associated beta strand protein
MKTTTCKTQSAAALCGLSRNIALCLAVLAGVSLAQAGLFVKTNNVDALNLATSWTNNTVPGAADIAQWDNTLSDPNNTTNTLGANASWSGIRIVDPAGPVQINAGNTLTLGASGIDMSAATADLIMSNALTLPDYTVQAWNVPSGRNLLLEGAFARTGGAALTFNSAGTINIAGGTASSGLFYSLINGTDVGALDASKNVSTVAAVKGYTSVSAFNPSAPTQYIDFDSTSTATGTADDLNMNTKISYPLVYHFNVPQPSGRGFWQLNAYKGQFELNSGPNTILVTTNVGACNVIFEETGGGITMGWRQSSGGSELIIDQENTGGSIYFENGLSQKNAFAGNMLTKRGAGRAVFNTGLVHSGPTRILQGELMLNSTTVASSVTTVNPGATLSGIGTVSGPVNNNGTIWAGTNGLGTLTLSGSVTLNAGSSLSFYSESVPASNTVAALNVTGNLLMAGPVNVSILAGVAAVGQYPLIKWTNAISGGGFADLNLMELPLRTEGYLSNNVANDSIDLVVTNVNEPISWAVGSQTWDINTTTNWVDTYLTPTTYQQSHGVGDSVLFSDSASGSSPITVTLNANPYPASVTVNASKSYVLTGNGSISGQNGLTKTGTGTLTLATTNTFSGGIYINGGIVNFNSLTNLGLGGINFGGGTLQYNGNTDDISTRAVTFNAGGATIDNAGQTLNFANPVGNAGMGGLTSTGAGSLTLNGTNKYSGNTVVNQGTLALGAGTCLTNSAAIIVNGGAVLDAASSGVNLVLSSPASQMLAGTGTVKGTVTLPSGTSISPATNGVYGTLNLGNDLTISGGNLFMDVSTTNHDLIAVSGNLTISSGSLLVISNSVPLTNGVYRLITYGGSLLSGAGSSGNLTLVFSQTGKAATLSDATPNEIDLIISDTASDVIAWSGTGSTWDLAGTQDWLLNGVTPWAFTNGDQVTFNDSNTGNTTAQLQSSLLPSAVTVSNSAIAVYTFADGTGVGGGKISGSASLVKDGTGTLIVQTANSCTGPTTIKNGTLQIGNGGIGDIGTGNVTNNGALVFAQGDGNTHMVGGQISGAGTLTQQGSVTVVLTNNNTYTGATTINGGALQAGTGGATGSLGTGAVTNNAMLILNRSGSVTVPNNISGSGALAQTGPATTVFTGSLAYQGNTYVSNGVVKLTANDQIPDANSVSGSTGWLVLDGGATAGIFDLAGFNETINSLSGLAGVVNGGITNSGTAAATNILTVLGSATTTYNGSIADNSSGTKTALVIRGANELRLNGNNTYNGGTLVADSATLGFGPGAVIGNGGQITLSNNATFYMHNNGSTASFPGNNLLIAPASSGTIGSSSAGNGYNGNVSGDSTATNVITANVSFNVAATEQWASFPGTVRIASGGSLRFASTSLNVNGGDNATFEVDGTVNTRNGTYGAGLSLGALNGTGGISGGGVSGSVGTKYVIGAKGIDSTFSGAISDGGAGNVSIVKVGTGTLTLNGGTAAVVSSPDGGLTYVTNNVLVSTLLNYTGSTTISNGVLRLAAPATLTNSPTPITLASTTAVLDATSMGYISTDGSTYTNLVTNGVFEVVSGQSLSGIGTINASNVLLDAGSTLNAGLPLGALTATHGMELAGAINMSVNATNTPNTSALSAQGFVVDGTASLVVTNIGPEYGATFQLFNHPVTIPSVTLPTLTGTNSWVNNLASNGSITLVAPSLITVNTNSFTITNVYSVGNLNLSWPADHVGWRLQVETNTLSVGLTTNWTDWPGSTNVSSESIPVAITNGAVFFRMVYP